MNNIKDKYNKLVSDIENVNNELTVLEEDSEVRKYIELKKKSEELYNRKVKLYREFKYDEYNTCNHILISTRVNYDKSSGHFCRSVGCIKCGLDNSVIDCDRDLLTEEEKIKYDYLIEYNVKLEGLQTNILCDIDLATEIYCRIKRANPNIDDIIGCKYFEIALDNIRNIKVSKERKESRIKRLSLKPGFKNWNEKSLWNN